MANKEEKNQFKIILNLKKKKNKRGRGVCEKDEKQWQDILGGELHQNWK